MDVVQWSREQAQDRQAAGERVGVEIERQDGRERRDRDFVHAQGALHRIAADTANEIGASGDDPGLRAAEQLVSAEGDEIRAVAKRFAGSWLVRETERPQVR